MPLPTCDPTTPNSLRQSDQLSACLQKSALAATYELPEEIFLAVVIDCLQRLAIDGVAGFSNLNLYTPCDGEKNAHHFYVRFVQTTLPIQASATQMKQQILWQLGNALCVNNA